MGGHPYQYVVPFQADAQRALDALHADVFARGQYFGAESKPSSIKEALARSSETGTRSILDIERVSKTPALRGAAPFSVPELEKYFRGDRPTVKEVEECDVLWEDLERGMARYVVAYENGVPVSLVFVGYSFD